MEMEPLKYEPDRSAGLLKDGSIPSYQWFDFNVRFVDDRPKTHSNLPKINY